MTETEWLTGDRPESLLRFAVPRLSDRKVRLFACACARHLWRAFDHPRARPTVELAERFADGLADARDLHRAWTAVKAVAQATPRSGMADDYFGPAGVAYELRSVVRDVAHPAIRRTIMPAVRDALQAEFLITLTAARTDVSMARAHEIARKGLPRARAVVCGWVRDIAGNLVRPVHFDARWRTADVTGLAWSAYDDRAFDRLPLLADALMDAGCADADILAHCRSAGPHVRGCWVVDLALGKM
jgi:hypothetical protein